jgi:hypothetical protein
MGVLRVAPPVSVLVWDVHHNCWNEHHSHHQTTSGVITKMRNADSAFPRTNLAVWIVMCIAEHEESAVVLARFNFLPVQSKYGRTEPIVIGTRCAR